MRQVQTILFAAAALTWAALPAYAAGRPDFNAPYPVQHMREMSMAPQQPYAMNYTDQMAQKLGVKDGQWEAFHSRDPLIPSLNGGMGASGHPMLKLQWTP
jgi:hypothetical protein